jgi:hypothetical protein
VTAAVVASAVLRLRGEMRGGSARPGGPAGAAPWADPQAPDPGRQTGSGTYGQPGPYGGPDPYGQQAPWGQPQQGQPQQGPPARYDQPTDHGRSDQPADDGRSDQHGRSRTPPDGDPGRPGGSTASGQGAS